MHRTDDGIGRPLLVGVAVGDVTPPVGIDVSGFALRGPTRGVHRDLRVGVTVMSDGRDTVCLVTADVVGFTVQYASELRSEIARRLGIESHGVLLSASHTHNAPSLTLDLKIGGRQDEWTELDETYQCFWRAKTLSLCEVAHETVAPARIGVSRAGRSRIGVQRRVRMPDGRIIIGRDPDGPADHSIGVVRIDRPDGSAALTIINYACHPISLGPEAEIVSPDFPGAARQQVEAITGAPAVFIQGAGADVAPIEGMGADPSAADHLGRLLGLSAAAAWADIETRNIERREVLVQSYNAIARLEKVERTLPPAFVRSAETWLELPLEGVPTREEIAGIADSASATFEDLLAQGASEGELNRQRLETRWARFLGSFPDGRLPTTARGVVQALRVGLVTFVALPVEPFVDIGLALIDQLGEGTIVCGYTNGTVGYCPMPEDYEEGGYEVERAHHLYQQPGALSRDVAALLVETGVRMADGIRPPGEEKPG